MAKQWQLRRGTTQDMLAFTGAEGELTYDISLKQLVIHDGTTVGGKFIDVPKNSIDGFIMSRNTTILQKLDIASGQCRDYSNLRIFDDNSVTARINSSGAGGLFSGSVSPNTWYHVFLIQNDTDGKIRAGFSTSLNASDRPSGYSHYRRIGSIKTDGSSNITDFFQHGDLFLWKSPPLDYSVASLGTTTSVFVTLPSVPPGLQVLARLNVLADGSAGAVYVSPIDITNEAPDVATGRYTVHSTSDPMAANFEVLTDTSQQIRVRATATGVGLKIRTLGWIDPRGKTT